MLKDNVKAWDLDSFGNYSLRKPLTADAFDSQEFFIMQACESMSKTTTGAEKSSTFENDETKDRPKNLFYGLKELFKKS